MNLFILGATGAIGKHLLDSALERGHQVTSYVRSPQKIHLTHERLKVVRGSVFDIGQMAHSLTGHDIILSAFGPTTVRSSTLRREFGRTLAAAMRKSGVLQAQIVRCLPLSRYRLRRENLKGHAISSNDSRYGRNGSRSQSK